MRGGEIWLHRQHPAKAAGGSIEAALPELEHRALKLSGEVIDGTYASGLQAAVLVFFSAAARARRISSKHNGSLYCAARIRGEEMASA